MKAISNNQISLDNRRQITATKDESFNLNVHGGGGGGGLLFQYNHKTQNQDGSTYKHNPDKRIFLEKLPEGVHESSLSQGSFKFGDSKMNVASFLARRDYNKMKQMILATHYQDLASQNEIQHSIKKAQSERFKMKKVKSEKISHSSAISNKLKNKSDREKVSTSIDITKMKLEQQRLEREIDSLKKKLTLPKSMTESKEVVYGNQSKFEDMNTKMERLMSMLEYDDKKINFGTSPSVDRKAFSVEPNMEFTKHLSWRSNEFDDNHTRTRKTTAESSSTPERQAMLSAAIDSLRRERKSQQKRKNIKDGLINRYKTRNSGSVLIPRKPKMQQFLQSQTTKYADETIASLLKKTNSEFVLKTKNPEKTKHLATKSIGKKIHSTHTLQSPEKKYVRFTEEEEAAHDMQKRRASLVRHDILSSEDSANRMMENVETAMRERLKPLLDKAQAMADAEEKRIQAEKTNVKLKLAELATDTAISRGDVLADSILDDLILEAAQDFQQLERQEKEDEDAAKLFDQPSLDVVIQRLSEMEVEEDSIRRHWKQLHYGQIEIGSINTDSQSVLDANKNTSDRISRAYPNPIVFTSDKEELNPIEETESTKELSGLPSAIHAGQTMIHLRPETIQNITNSAQDYQEYLFRTSNIDREAGFDPWKFVDEICDKLFEEITEEVANEVNEACSDLVDGVYAEEFVESNSLYNGS